LANTDLRARTIAFAVAVTRFTERLPKSRSTDIFARQLIRAASSVGANYRSAGRAQSTAHLISKLAIVEEEADECGYWLELLVATCTIGANDAEPLLREASEITAMMVASKKRLRARMPSSPRRNSQFAIRNSETSS
jgi:four helix bundle protein